MDSIKRGDIVTVAAPGDYGKPRPALVVQSDLFNATHASISLLPIISTLVAAPLFRITVEPSRERGLKRRSQVRFATSVALALVLTLSGCEYAKLLRPKALKQLNPEMVALVNELPELDNANEAIIGRLFPHGGLSRADLGRDGIFRDAVAVPENQYIWRPAIIVMQRPGRLELDFSNDDNGASAPARTAFTPQNHRPALPTKYCRRLLR